MRASCPLCAVRVDAVEHTALMSTLLAERVLKVARQRARSRSPVGRMTVPPPFQVPSRVTGWDLAAGDIAMMEAQRTMARHGDRMAFLRAAGCRPLIPRRRWEHGHGLTYGC